MREAFSHLREDYTEDELVVVSNHCADDYANTYTNYRKGYCSVTGYPTAMVDFMHKLVGTYSTWQLNYDWLSTRIDIQLTKTPPGSLDLDYFFVGDDVYLEATVNLEEDLENEWWVWMLVYQEDWDGFEFVVRDGDYSPSELLISSEGESDTYYWHFDPTGWDLDQLVAVAFLEKNFSNKEVCQAIMLHLDMGRPDDHEPIVVDQDPEHGEDDVSVDSTIEFTLVDDVGIDLDTLDFTVEDDTRSSGSRFLSVGGQALRTGYAPAGEITGDLDIDDSDPQEVVCTFTPDEDLPFEATITCTIASGLEDTDGNPTEEDVTWNFITEEYVRVEETSWGAIKAQF